MNAPDPFSLGGRQTGLVEVERQCNAARARFLALADDATDEDADIEWDEVDRLTRLILHTEPRDLADCVVKLRLMADTSIGIETGARTDNGDAIAVRQVLAFLDRAGGQGGEVQPGGTATDPEIIVDEEEKAALALLVHEPVLGPLAHRAFGATERYANATSDHPLYDEWRRVYEELDRELDATRAETIGGIAWRLFMLCRLVDDTGWDFGEYVTKQLRFVCEDAKRLAHPGGGDVEDGGELDVADYEVEEYLP